MTSINNNRFSMDTGRNRENQSSSLLSQEENEQLFQLLGSKKQTQSTAVAQIFTTDPPHHSAWVKRHTGVLCFIKDSARRSYYIQMYCLDRNQMVWEHEVYEPFILNKPRSFLLTFEGKDCIISLNFASDDEAETFFQAVRTHLANKMKKKEERLRRTPKHSISVNKNYVNKDDDSVSLRKPKHNITTHSITTTNTKNNRLDKKYGKKFSKADIGTPSGFTHVTHVGWDSYKGFNFAGGNEETLKPFLEKAGVSQKLLKNRETKAFIMDFLEENNVYEKIKEEQTLPPVPKRQSQILAEQQQNMQKPNRVAPPIPPSRVHPSLPNSVPKPPRIVKPELPKRNEPSSSGPTTGAPAPPPPPPPPPAGLPPMAPAPPPMQPKSEHPSSNRPPQMEADPRDALLESIRKGATLRKVNDRNRPPLDLHHSPDDQNEEAVSSSDALALALKRALEQRKGAIQSDSEEESDESFDNDEEWDD
uniref:CSON010686 protein n=1 Tax=Culicoides sonorensis TaxID=179676 RepID=A0A336KBC5_CULSO